MPTNYVAYVDARLGVARIGHLDFESDSITPLTFKSGTPVASLYQVIEAGAEHIAAAPPPRLVASSSESENSIGGAVNAFPASSVKILPPLAGRDVLAVGKNYAEHAVEFNSSGYDSSDKVAQPTHPVIFSKRATAIVAHGDAIYAHPDFTQSLDYEGEIGVIVGKSGFRISEEEAWDHVWGFTIINDVTARERQRDHKQFLIGKSADTTAPMGPVAVSKENLPQVLRVQTVVNGELRQDATTEDLIFSIPFLIKTVSEGMTIQPGDVIATGTPAGVGIGKKPPVFLKAGDEIAISVTGMGTLKNKVTDSLAAKNVSSFPSVDRTPGLVVAGGESLAMAKGKPLYWKRLGQKDAETVVFLHDLGGSSECWMPLIAAASLEQSHSLIVHDFEGHGLSPTSPLSVLSVESFSNDLEGLFTCAEISGATVVAHGFASLVALSFVSSNPGLVKKLVFISPPPLPLTAAARAHAHARSELARTSGTLNVAREVASSETSEHTKRTNPLALTALNLAIRGQDNEGYAKACCAFASAGETLDLRTADVDTTVIFGGAFGPPALKLHPDAVPQVRHVELPNVGRWAVFEDPAGLARAIVELL
ncbi:uncharacterized protein J3D65DRAFT_628872 [Phyllosticta citribraziliensis]|uniref:Fumarylacetoacetate hydrolase n=1 Tax=Phyllosticta citribraziliensis TaxID=989973 RepID=A0ABR1LHP9_9PEZI